MSARAPLPMPGMAGRREPAGPGTSAGSAGAAEPVGATRVRAEAGAEPAGPPGPSVPLAAGVGPAGVDLAGVGPAGVAGAGPVPGRSSPPDAAMAPPGPVTGADLAASAPARISPAAVTSSSQPGAGRCSIVASARANTPAISSRTRGSRTAAGDGSTGPALPGAAPFSR